MERKEPPGATPASQETIPSLYPPLTAPLQGISFPWLKYKQTNPVKCWAQILPRSDRMHPASTEPPWSPAASSSGPKAALAVSPGSCAPTGSGHCTAPLLPALCCCIPRRCLARDRHYEDHCNPILPQHGIRYQGQRDFWGPSGPSMESGAGVPALTLQQPVTPVCHLGDAMFFSCMVSLLWLESIS